MLICMYLCDSMRCDVMINLILGVMSFQAHTDHLHTTYVSIVSNELHSLHTENRLWFSHSTWFRCRFDFFFSSFNDLRARCVYVCWWLCTLLNTSHTCARTPIVFGSSLSFDNLNSVHRHIAYIVWWYYFPTGQLHDTQSWQNIVYMFASFDWFQISYNSAVDVPSSLLTAYQHSN